MKRETFDKTEALIGELTAKIARNDEYRDAAYAYLLAAAEGKDASPETQQRVMGFIALALEGCEQSIRMNSGKRRNFCAGAAFFSRRLWQHQQTTTGLSEIAGEFDLPVENLRKIVERTGMMGADLKIELTESYTPPKSKDKGSI